MAFGQIIFALKYLCSRIKATTSYLNALFYFRVNARLRLSNLQHKSKRACSLFFIFFYSPSLLLSLPSPFSSPFIFFCVFLIVFRTDLCFSIINELEATPARGPSFPPPFCNESQRINLHQINFSRTKKHHSLFWQFIVRQIFAKFLILFFKGFVHGHAEQTTPFFFFWIIRTRFCLKFFLFPLTSLFYRI